jgi:LysM repeat protein
MRRTTIFRSNLAAAVAAVFLVTTATAEAQDNTRGGQQIQGQTVHVVQTGETLWELAQRYLGDPFLWPEIFRLNTIVVEDPHWIFPGEELRLAPPSDVPGPEIVARPPERVDTAQAVAVEPPRPMAPAPPPTETAPTVFIRRSADDRILAREHSPAYRYHAVRKGEFYSAGFLTEGEQLPWAEVLGAVARPALPTLPTTSQARVFQEIELRAPQAAAYQVGDSLLVATLPRDVTGWGRVVKPTGIVRVSAVAGSKARAEVVSQFNRVADGQYAIPLERFDDPGDVVPVPVENGAMGEIIELRDPAPFVGQQAIVFIDLGRSDGIVLGDVFEVLRRRDPEMAASGQAWDVVAIMHIVHVRDLSASGFIINVFDTPIGNGDPVRLIRKMPS